MADTDPLIVGVDWLADRLDAVRTVDVRDAWEYQGIGHVPGAVSLPFETVRSAGDEDAGMLPGLDRFEALMSEIGLEPDEPLVAYDDEHGVFAARVLVTAMLYGHERIHLLDGDFTAWSRSYETSTEPVPVEPTGYRGAIPPDRPLIDSEGVLAAIDDPDAVLLDTRTPEEFADGHLAGAINIDWRAFVDPDSRGLKPADELIQMLAGMGIGPADRIVLYCNTARRISHTYLVLSHLGFESVDFYEGSLTEWRELDLALVRE